METLIREMKAEGWNVKHETAGTVTFERPDDYSDGAIVLSLGLEFFDVARFAMPTRRWDWVTVEDVLAVASRERPGDYASGGERIPSV